MKLVLTKLMIANSAGGKVVARVPIGDHPDGAYYDADTATVFSSNGAGSPSVVRQIDANHYAQPAEVPTVRGAGTMAFDLGSRRGLMRAVVDK